MVKLIFLLSTIVWSGNVMACMCIKESVETKYQNYPIIFHAKGTGEQIVKNHQTLSYFQVVKSFKGDLKKDQQLALNTEILTSCEGPTASKTQWLIFAYYNEDNLLTVNKCGATNIEDEAALNANEQVGLLIEQLERLQSKQQN